MVLSLAGPADTKPLEAKPRSLVATGCIRHPVQLFSLVDELNKQVTGPCSAKFVCLPYQIDSKQIGPTSIGAQIQGPFSGWLVSAASNSTASYSVQAQKTIISTARNLALQNRPNGKILYKVVFWLTVVGADTEPYGVFVGADVYYAKCLMGNYAVPK